MPESMLCLNVAPGLEPELVDWLSVRSDVSGFSSMTGFGHGRQHALDSIAEHVAGKARRVHFQVLLEDAVSTSLLDDLAADFSGADIMYWVLAVSCSGTLDRW